MPEPTSPGASTRYRVIWHRAITVTPQDFIDAFPAEWTDAQHRGLDEHGFAVESIRACDYETLVDLGENEDDDFEWEPT